MEEGRWQATCHLALGTPCWDVFHLDVKYTCTNTCSLGKGTKSKLKCTRLWNCTCAKLWTIIIITMYVRFLLVDLLLTFLDFFENAPILTLWCFYAYKNAYRYKFSHPDSEYIPNMSRSDHCNKLLEIYISHIEAGLGVSAPSFIFCLNVFPSYSNCYIEPYLQIGPCFICHLNVFSSYQNCSKDLNLQTSTSNSKSRITKYIQIGPSLQKFWQSIYFAQRPVWGFEPPNFIFHLNIFPLDSNCANETSLQTGPAILNCASN